ncbi:MAG TPA: 3-keto-5-aminohexanoate cleavage protein [Devosia sp.]|nr:3-keto-5-aminohexanoate cleavage protein [Devosia sp.]
MKNKVIISCAITGAIHTPSMSPHLPVTTAQIVESAIGAAKAGAAIVHLHARDDIDGRPVQTVEAFRAIAQPIRDAAGVVINFTTGGGQAMSVEQRLQPTAGLKPELASLNMGTMNFVTSPMLNRFKDFSHDWEEKALRSSEENIFKNSFRDIEYIIKSCTDGGTRFEFECYDTGHLYALAHFADRGLIKAPFFVQTIFGILGGTGTHPEDVMHMKRTADRLFGSDYKWSVLGAGRMQFPIATMALTMGSNIRVGIEDSLWIGRGKLAESNAQQVTKAREIIENLGLEVASPDEARAMLNLKGAAAVGF